MHNTTSYFLISFWEQPVMVSTYVIFHLQYRAVFELTQTNVLKTSKQVELLVWGTFPERTITLCNGKVFLSFLSALSLSLVVQVYICIILMICKIKKKSLSSFCPRDRASFWETQNILWPNIAGSFTCKMNHFV